MLFVVYALISLLCLLNLWLYGRMRTSTDSETWPNQPGLRWLLFSLPLIGLLIISLIMIQLREFQYLPGLLALALTTLPLMIKAR
ncbi:MAG: hypothetical protein ACXIUL_10905 [Wenzhouxiangella sp.]